MNRLGAVAAALCIALQGCGAVIHKWNSMDDTTKPVVLTMDAKQRFVFFNPASTEDPDTIRRHAQLVVCAEPSPDTMVGVAASLGLDIPLHTGSVEMAQSVSQAVAAIGNRTQTIALLRDALYRACEAYMNGIMDADEYRTMVHHYDMTMVMLVAIDGLTRSCTQQASISTNAQGQHGSTGGTGNGATDGSKQSGGQDAGKDDGKTDDGKQKAAKAGAKDDAAGANAGGGKDAGGKDKATGGAPASPSATSSASVNSTAAGTCPDADKVAGEIRAMVKEFFIYKAPLHRWQCKVETIKRLVPMPTRNASGDPKVWKAALDVADSLCDGAYFDIVKKQIEAEGEKASPAPLPAKDPAAPGDAAKKGDAKKPATAKASDPVKAASAQSKGIPGYGAPK